MPLGDRLERRAVEALVGRRAELERLEDFALGDEPVVVYIQGIPGIGKTHLLSALMARIGEKGVSVVRIDARWCEPSAAALCRAISREIGVPESEDSPAVVASLSEMAKQTLLVLDRYESFRLLDSWLRQVFRGRSANTMVDGAGGGWIRYFASLAAYAIGVSSDRCWMERLARPGSISARYWRIGTPSLRQLSTMLKMAAILGPASLLPMCSQFRRPIEIGRMEFSAQFVDSSTTG